MYEKEAKSEHKAVGNSRRINKTNNVVQKHSETLEKHDSKLLMKTKVLMSMFLLIGVVC